MKDKYTELSERETEFCEWFEKCKGAKNWKKTIAKKMSVELCTVNTHKQNIFVKLCVNTQTELMHKLLTRGILND